MHYDRSEQSSNLKRQKSHVGLCGENLDKISCQAQFIFTVRAYYLQSHHNSSTTYYIIERRNV